MASSATVVLPSSSPFYSYDYGVTEKLPFDTRIVSESTQSDFEDQGPKIIGTIQYLDKEDIGIDTSNVSNVDKVKVYQSDLSFETISKLNEIRGLNSLENR